MAKIPSPFNVDVSLACGCGEVKEGKCTGAVVAGSAFSGVVTQLPALITIQKHTSKLASLN